MKNLPILLFIFFSFSLWSQSEKASAMIDWKLLEDVEFKDQYFQEYEAWYLVPSFGEKVKKYANKSVVIRGYVIPMDVDGKEYALSHYPFSACFFCGGAGPESVMNLDFKEYPKRFETDEFLYFKGTLRLNDSDFEGFSYILEDCELIDP